MGKSLFDLKVRKTCCLLCFVVILLSRVGILIVCWVDYGNSPQKDQGGGGIVAVMETG